MKTIIFTLLLVLSANAFKIDTTSVKLSSTFMGEFSAIITQMENSCSETLVNAKNDIYPNESFLKLKVHVDCDYKIANSMFKSFYEKYCIYLNGYKYERLIDSTIKTVFPQYQLMWGTRFNNETFPFIQRILPYDATLSNNNKCMFYKVVVDSDTVGIIMTSFSGYSLDYANYDTMSDDFYYTIRLPKKNITDINLIKTTKYDMVTYITEGGHLIDLD